MDNKFYVSYEAARLLKDKGYSDFTKSVYRESNPSNTLFFKGESRDWNNMISPYTAAPTKAEAIDWLESKGIMISVVYDNLGIIGKKHYRSIIDTLDKDGSESGSPIYLPSYDGDIRHYSTRLEAEEAAIIKALELL
jgi:hypothetical protein